MFETRFSSKKFCFLIRFLPCSKQSQSHYKGPPVSAV